MWGVLKCSSHDVRKIRVISITKGHGTMYQHATLVPIININIFASCTMYIYICD